MRGRCEPAHLSFALPRGLMRDLRSIVLVLPGAVHHGRHHGAARGRVAAQLVRDQMPTPSLQTADESLGTGASFGRRSCRDGQSHQRQYWDGR